MNGNSNNGIVGSDDDNNTKNCNDENDHNPKP